MLNLSLPLLAILNTADTLLSFWIFRIFGIDEELNPVIKVVLAADNSAILFLILKIGLSLVLFAYWKMASNIKTGVSVMSMLGAVVYGSVFVYGVLTVLIA